MTLSDSGIYVTHAVGNSNFQWNGIEKINTNGDTACVYVGAMVAHIISRNSVVDSEYDLFIGKLQRRL